MGGLAQGGSQNAPRYAHIVSDTEVLLNMAAHAQGAKPILGGSLIAVMFFIPNAGGDG